MKFPNIFHKKNMPLPQSGRQQQLVPSRVNLTPQQRRQVVLDQLASFYAGKVAAVCTNAGVPGKVTTKDVNARSIGIGVVLANTLDLKRASNLANEIGLAAGLGDGSKETPVRVVILGNMLYYQLLMPERVSVGPRTIALWEDLYADDPRLAGTGIGLGANSSPVYFDFLDAAPHTLVCGSTGSGKTFLMRTVLYKLMAYYPAEDLKIGIIDPKLDFTMFDDKAHLLFKSVHSREEITALIMYFHEEYEKRMTDSGRRSPRMVLFIDEADQGMVLGYPPNAARVYDIALRGRDLRMNLVIMTHRPDADSLGSIRTQLNQRFLGKTASAEESGHVEGGLKLHRLTGRGDFFRVVGHDTFQFQAAMVLSKDLTSLEAGQVDAISAQDIIESYLAAHQKETRSELEVPVSQLAMMESKPTGRPRNDLDDEFAIAWYFHRLLRGQTITAGEAKDKFGFSRQRHLIYLNRLTKALEHFNELEAVDEPVA